MKKIFLFFILIFSFFFVQNIAFGATGACDYDIDEIDAMQNVGDALNECLTSTKLVNASDASVGSGFGTMIKNWVNNIALYLGVLAVGAIVVGSLMMTLSAGEEDKIKKAKDIVKWGIIGFIGLISASAIINLVVKIMYSI